MREGWHLGLAHLSGDFQMRLARPSELSGSGLVCWPCPSPPPPSSTSPLSYLSGSSSRPLGCLQSLERPLELYHLQSRKNQSPRSNRRLLSGYRLALQGPL